MPDDMAVVRRVIDAMNRADLDEVAESSSEDFELDFSNSRGPMSGIYRGREGVRAFLTSFGEAWEALEFEPTELIELGDHRVLTAVAVRARGHESGADVTARGATIWTIRDGEIAAVKMYQSKAEALDAVSAEG
jgi:ketosteroid isomerase-like protein